MLCTHMALFYQPIRHTVQRFATLENAMEELQRNKPTL
jgi:hypothetical protein